MKEDYSTLVPKNRKNYSKSPKEISIYISDKIIAEQQKSINKKNNFERYGKSKEYIEIGIKERLSGLHDFNIINRIMTEVENLNRGALLSYIYGYTEASDRRLVIGIVNKEFNQAQLENIGYIDAIDPNIEFEKLRNKFIKNIHQFFEKNNINSNNYINLFANNTYFPEYLKQQLISEFNKYGVIEGKIIPQKEQLPIIFTIDFDINYKKEPFNFIRNKELKMNFHNYILLMQNNEYDRQYLIDAMGKFLGYLLSSEYGNKKFKDTNILEKIMVYGTNDLFLPDTKEYNISSIVSAIIKELISNKNIYNNEIIKNYLIICSKFLSIIESKEIESVISENKIDTTLFNNRLDESKMQINIIKSLNSFNDIGTYHNYTSKVMPKYTEMEANLLSNEFSNKNAKLLDIMCGYGRIANQLKKIGYNDITGIDIGDYNFLGVPKDFVFIKDNFLDYKFSDNYDYAYSLYNCYKDNEELYKTLKKTYSLLKENGKLVIDCFNKSWRDSIDKDFYKEIYIDENYKLIIRRDYDFKTGNELTVYELYRENIKIKDFTFVQKFFEIDDILDILDNKWSYNLANSNDSQTRNNSQKHIMILRKK